MQVKWSHFGGNITPSTKAGGTIRPPAVAYYEIPKTNNDVPQTNTDVSRVVGSP